MDAAAEGECRGWSVAGDVEAVGVDVHPGVAVGRAGDGVHGRPGWHLDVVDDDVVERRSEHTLHDGRVAQHLVDGRSHEFGPLTEQRPLVWVVDERVDARRQLVAGRVGSAAEHRRDEHA